jgi:hypothetical protein
MKNLLQLRLEFSKNEQLTQIDLTEIKGGRRRNKSKFKSRRDDDYRLMSITYSLDMVEGTSDDKRRPRPGGGTTTTSPSSFL